MRQRSSNLLVVFRYVLNVENAHGKRLANVVVPELDDEEVIDLGYQIFWSNVEYFGYGDDVNLGQRFVEYFEEEKSTEDWSGLFPDDYQVVSPLDQGHPETHILMWSWSK